MENEEIENRKAKRKEMVDAKYGAGTYDKAILKLNPHRCAPHLNEIFYGVGNHWDFGTIGTFFKCMVSEKGQEPPRKYPQAQSFLDEIKQEK
jgi:hypothetical protein